MTFMDYLGCLGWVLLGLGCLFLLCLAIILVINVGLHIWDNYLPYKAQRVLSGVGGTLFVLAILFMLFVAMPVSFCMDTGRC